MTGISDVRFFNDLFANYRLRFVRFANTYVRDLVVAEDITMEAFMVYWENRENLPPDSNIPAYVLTIIKNRCLNHIQHNEVRYKAYNNIQSNVVWETQMRIMTLEACNPEQLFSFEVEKIVNDTLSTLPERTFEVFRLSRYENRSHKEIAAELNITTKGVEFHITKALSLLRERLKDYMTFIMTLLSA
ncbi:RNA polymerase sigma-70 factor [Dysgonomonas sp. Marseille-P4677]|uniref:RNA polymerase sigma-70 factor n=1 Tax=Dysgonomonas sp. Marseille-P4677 TaxID=2364790 RepID=UPI001914C250|nr:RNA polymerase sigma-70 factor [Dysgonomonas sp. Marseille-P4677]MBK5720504.1 RNA polymerase sigma-70 factor [Dysgonomonas sp. Marseille-P4677]